MRRSARPNAPVRDGLICWLRPELGVILSGGHVSTWADQSGTGNDLLAPAIGPTPLSNWTNGMPALQFDDTINPQYVQRAAWVGGSLVQPLTVVLACSVDDAAAQRMVSDAGTAPEVVVQSVSGAADAYAGSSLASFDSLLSPVIVVAEFAGASSKLWVGGHLTSGAAGANSMDGITLGASYLGTTTLKGKVGEAMVYAKALTSGERRHTALYAARRFGLTWAE